MIGVEIELNFPSPYKLNFPYRTYFSNASDRVDIDPNYPKTVARWFFWKVTKICQVCQIWIYSPTISLNM
jgi:hypothetical protein